MLAGVVGACALGASLGLWARPAAEDRGLETDAPEAAAAPSPEPTRILQIVVDDTPAPVGLPMDVLPDDLAPGAGPAPQAAAMAPPAPRPVEPLLPRRPPEGLMKVAAPVEAEPVVVAPPAPRPSKPDPRTEKVAVRPKAASKAETVRPKAEKAVARSAKKAPKPEQVRVARAEKPKPRKDDKVRLAKAEKPKVKPAEARSKAEAQKDVRLAAVVRAVKKAPAKLKDEVRLAERKAAQARKDREIRLAEARAEKKAQALREKTRRDKAAKVQLAKTEKAKKAKPAGREPQVRQARNTCVSADPGEALVCGDPRLNVRERQMQRAYRDAEAAGVPASELRRQQERWRAARAAAAREAPWAVEEVYEARIAELNDLSRSDRSY